VFLPLSPPNPIQRKSTAAVHNPATGRAPRGAARHGTARYGTQPPPRLYFLAGVTRGAYFYGLYYFAFLECALPGVNPRPQFGQCTREGWTLITVETERKGVPPWWVRGACRASTRNLCPALAALVAKYKICFPHLTLFQFICPHHPASWTGSRAGLPVS
jgi:hypothetical protein